MSEKTPRERADDIDRRWGVDPVAERRLDEFMARTQAPQTRIKLRPIAELREKVEALFMGASILSSADARVRSLAFAEVLDIIDGVTVEPAQRIKDIERRMIAEKEAAK